jgi:hypothetical protein
MSEAKHKYRKFFLSSHHHGFDGGVPYLVFETFAMPLSCLVMYADTLPIKPTQICEIGLQVARGGDCEFS